MPLCLEILSTLSSERSGVTKFVTSNVARIGSLILDNGSKGTGYPDIRLN